VQEFLLFAIMGEQLKNYQILIHSIEQTVHLVVVCMLFLDFSVVWTLNQLEFSS